MNNRLKYVSSAFFCALPMLFPTICTAATVNSHEVEIGDIVTYEVHAISCPTNVDAVDVSVFYDSSSLTYIENSIELPALSSPVYNTELLGEIRFNAVTLEGYDFNDDSVLFKASFEVTDDLLPDISLYCSVKNFLDENKQELKDTYVYDITQVEKKQPQPSAAIEQEQAPEQTTSVVESGTGSEQNVSIASSHNESTVVSGDTSTPSGSQNENSRSEEDITSENEQADIPSEKAILLETHDAPQQHGSNRSVYLPIFVSGIGIIIVIAVMISILKNDKGKHFE